ncbi:MAG TPA: ABC transporter permease [Vicinamibacterales bacterium]|nr:ABC transporter permease [Vicinamibacterales bacterium]
MSGLWRDVVHTLRLLARHRGFAAAVLVTIALGVGGVSAVFSVVYGVLIQPLPYQQPDRLVRLWEVHRGAQALVDEPLLTNLTYQRWQRSSATLDGLGAFDVGMYTVANAGPVERLRGVRATPSLFSVLRVAPAHGRFFDAADSEKGAARVVVLTDATWRARFGGAPVLDKRLAIDGENYRVVGIAPPGFAFPGPEADRPSDERHPVSFYIPMAVPSEDDVDIVDAIGRLKDGVTVVQAETEGTSVARAVERPGTANVIFGAGGPVDVHVRALAGEMTTRIRSALLVLAAAVCLVLLIVCANVANLFLLRSTGRARELLVRTALGAGPRRIVRQLLTESLVVSLVGGGLGLFIGWAAIAALPFIAPSNFPRLDAIHFDGRVLVVAALACVSVGACAGVMPAVRCSQLDLSTTIGSGGRTVSTHDTGARRLLLVVEAALAVVLLVGTTLLARSFVNLTRVDPGYDATNVLTADVMASRASDTSRLTASVLERLRDVPGVHAAGAGSMAPFGNMIVSVGFELPGVTTADGRPVIAHAYRAVITPGYAEALGMRILEGRFFREADEGASIAPMLVNASFAKKYFADGKVAVGRTFTGLFGEDDRVVEVVGVVADVLPADLDASPQPQIYTLRDAATTMRDATLIVKTSGDSSSTARLLRRIVQQIDPGATLDHLGPLGSKISASVSEPRLTTLVLAVFAGLALTLAATGLYGVLSYSVAQRRREIGVRAALGATRGELVAMVLREGLGVTAIGLVIGVTVAAFTMHAMANVLFGVAPLDVVAFTMAPLLLVVVAVAACLVPAWRAATIDPRSALNAE